MQKSLTSQKIAVIALFYLLDSGNKLKIVVENISLILILFFRKYNALFVIPDVEHWFSY